MSREHRDEPTSTLLPRERMINKKKEKEMRKSYKTKIMPLTLL